MGDIIKAIYDDYSDYKKACEVMNIEALLMGSGFYKHGEEIMKMKKYQKLLKEKKVPYL